MYVIKIVIIISIVLLLSGCWDREELSKVSIVTGMAVDKGEKFKYKLTIETTEAREMTTQTATGMAPSFVYSLEGNTVAELANKFNIANATRLVYSHMRLLAISEEVAEDNLLQFMDALDRNREIRDDFSIVVVRGRDAGDLLQVTNMYKKSPSLKLFSQLNHMQKEWGGAPDIKLNDYIRIYNALGQSPVLAAAHITGDPKKGGNIENMKSEDPESEVVVDSLAVIKQGKLAGFASLFEVRDLLFVQGKIKNTVLSVQCVKEDNKFGYHVTKSKTKITAKETNGIPKFHVNIRTEGYLEGLNCRKAITDANAFEGMEKSINKLMEKQIEKFIKKAKEEYDADIFGFGELLREQDYKSYKKYGINWDDGFEKSEIHVDFNSEIKRSGLRTNPYFMN
ncbi:Ger(x)C family spore germination protein [Niallia circulans]|uniref:Ger(X)C family spore germination protein n=1 Tax=Niallia circulans TaxID=1397 RepID=A0A553SS19_NIACI|nr:Ger(x)C family spore germination protein [Niallia circulans]TRZ39784.1 Ger(x)C family spore germination protein [Niallia circulans]